MTRVLSELLGAREPGFRQGIHALESAHGRPSTDIRLTSEVVQLTRSKLKELGLDAQDTTAEELYHALKVRVKQDDARLERRLRTLAAQYVTAEGKVEDGIVHALRNLPGVNECYALKSPVAKSLLKKMPPKRAMKQLGYRSLDSLLKHESAASVFAAAWVTESPAWRRSFTEQYKKLRPGDFESRKVAILTPQGRHWTKLAKEAVIRRKHTLVAFQELGAIVILPLPADKPHGVTTATLGLGLHAMNDIHAASTFLKLSQVRGDFGKVVQVVSQSQPSLQTSFLDQPVPWHIIQRYYSRAKHFFNTELFEPYLQAEDFNWHETERLLAHIEPSFDFWRGSQHLGLLHNSRAVSLNVVDAALNCCNDTPFDERVLRYGRASLWHELMLRYLKHDTVEQAVTSELQPALATEEAVL